jgi:hypothetical protein
VSDDDPGKVRDEIQSALFDMLRYHGKPYRGDPGVPGCRHRNAVPVTIVTGETVAWFCPDCETQLDAEEATREARP